MKKTVSKRRKYLRSDQNITLFGLGLLILTFILSPYGLTKTVLLSLGVTLTCVYFPAWDLISDDTTETEEYDL